MRRFVIRSIQFALLVVLTIGGFCAIEIAWEIRSYRREVIAPEGATVFVCGDSRTEFGLDPGCWPELFNFSVRGRPLDQTYLTASDILDANDGRLRTLIVDVSWEGMNFDYGAPLGAMGAAGQWYLLCLLHWRERMRDLRGLGEVVRSVMCEKRLRLVSKAIRGKRDFQSSLVSGYSHMGGCWQHEHPDCFERFLLKVRDDCCARHGADRVNRQYFQVLDRILELGRSRGVEVVLITAPWHEAIRRSVGTDNVCWFMELVDRYAREKGCRYLNLMEMDFPEECWFDANHLNAKGAALFTATVRDWVSGSRQ